MDEKTAQRLQQQAEKAKETPDRETQIEMITGRSKINKYSAYKEIRREVKAGRKKDGRTEEPISIDIDPDSIAQPLDFEARRVVNITEKDLPHIVLTQHDLEMLFPDGVPDFSDYPAEQEQDE